MSAVTGESRSNINYREPPPRVPTPQKVASRAHEMNFRHRNHLKPIVSPQNAPVLSQPLITNQALYRSECQLSAMEGTRRWSENAQGRLSGNLASTEHCPSHLRYQSRCVHPNDVCEPNELDHINPPLTGFYFRHLRLVPTERIRNTLLAEA